ncbi:uncharacterized protein [Primulina huaijiensis]|uniref:uncharacterized protein n=1 Tax=Primulina huaijiensis TaxID=1492673 RepID=UPI003CC78A64
MSKDRLSREFDVGVESFLQFALKNAIHSDAIPCPCERCGNLRKKNVETIRTHLYCNGMDLIYHTWIWHGERSTKGNSMNDNDRVVKDEDKSFSEELINVVHCVYVIYAENPSQFNKLLEDADKPLYPGCAKFTKLSAVVKLFNSKTKYSWSDKIFTNLLILFGEMLPDHNELPSSLYDAKKSLCALGMDYVKIHACPNDCILYQKEYEDFANCPTCGTSRWKLGNKSKVNEGIPATVLWYFPPIPRFQRMFRNKEISKELTWHADKRIHDGYLRHPGDSTSWKLVDRMWPDFAYEPRNLRLAVSTDGINPHCLMSSAYSCWLVLMITYNLSPWLCMKRKFVMITLLISSPRQPGDDIDVYLAPLINDLKCLWDKGVEAYDAYLEESFSLRDVLLWTINDFPAYGNMSGCVVKGNHACSICAEETYSTRLKHCRKMSYTGHRRFLPLSLPYRRQKKAFNGKQEFNLAPKPLSGVKVPVGDSSNVRNLVSMKDLKLFGLKSHDYHTLMQQLLPVAIRGVLPKHVRDTITRLCFFFNVLYSKVIDVLKLDDLQREIVKLCGPVWHMHTYPFERFMKILKGYVRNRNRPEGCIAKFYIAEEAVEFCSDYLSNVHTIGIPSRHREVELPKPLSRAVVHSTSHDELQQAHRYVLTNDAEIDPYVESDLRPINSFTHFAYILLTWFFYGVIEEIWELDYHKFQIPMFKCNWVENNNGIKVDDLGFTLVNLKRIGFKSDSFILGSQAMQVFYIEDPEYPEWSIVLTTPTRESFEHVNGDELEDTLIHYQSFTRGLPSMGVDRAYDNEPSCLREYCDKTWVDNV